MNGLRDYREWHRAYDDPASSLSWRLRMVQSFIARALDEHPGPVRVLSACSGDGRDVLSTLASRGDASRVTATLIEIDSEIAASALRAAAATDARVEVRIADAGYTDAYIGAVPAELVLLVGIFGNISNTDLQATIAAAPQVCAPGATLVWSRGREREDINAEIRGWFAAAGFSELEYATLETGSRPALGVVRYDGPPQAIQTGRHLFTFHR
jgi:hypothetical protein